MLLVALQRVRDGDFSARLPGDWTGVEGKISILILGQQLAENPETNLTAKQVEFARTIHGAGTDLLDLITDLLDLSKIESGTVTVDAQEVLFGALLDSIRRTFGHEAARRGAMPRLNGCETAERIRAQPWGQEVALVALSGWGQRQDRDRTASAGFCAHLVKPVGEAELLAVLAEIALPRASHSRAANG